MKTYLNIVGALALILGLLTLLAAESSVHEILGGIGLLTSCVALGAAKLIELGETHLERTSTQRLLEREQWEKQLAALRAPRALPPVPGTERFFVANGEEANGPHTRTALAELKKKGAISDETPVLIEGAAAWSTAAQVLR